MIFNSEKCISSNKGDKQKRAFTRNNIRDINNKLQDKFRNIWENDNTDGDSVH